MTYKRKIILTFLFLFIFSGIFLLAKSTDQIRNCCKLDNTITIKVKDKNITCNKGSLVGPDLHSANVCVAPEHGVTTSDNYCSGGETLGTINNKTTTIDLFCSNAANYPSSNCPGIASKGLWPTFCLLDAIINVTNLLFRILVIGASAMIVAGSIFIIYSSGDTKKWSTGKNLILYSLIALVVGLFAKGIPAIVSLVMGMKY
jgi:hypothetical protein